MRTLLIGLLVSSLGIAPMAMATGQAGRADRQDARVEQQDPAQDHMLSRGNVKIIQERLLAEGFDPGPVDGVIGPRTEGALRDYQERFGLPVSGAPDEATLRQMQVYVLPGGAAGVGGGAN